jgi:hypothetical protein
MIDQVAVYSAAVNGGHGPSLAEMLRPSALSQSTVREVGGDAVMEAFYTP